MPSSRIRLIACLVVMAGGVACRTWQAAPLPIVPAPTEAFNGRVALKSGVRFTVYDIRMAADSLLGTIRWSRGPTEPFAAAIRDIERLEVRRFHGGRTAGLVAAIATPVALGVTLVATCSLGCSVIID
jgi:hypothetical protein